MKHWKVDLIIAVMAWAVIGNMIYAFVEHNIHSAIGWIFGLLFLAAFHYQIKKSRELAEEIRNTVTDIKNIMGNK